MTPNEPTPSLFTDADIISSYSRAQAIEDGVLVDVREGDLAEVTRLHLGKTTPVAMTIALYTLIQKAVDNKRWMNDWRGVWHDVIWMSRFNQRISPDRLAFKVIITGCGRKRNHILNVVETGEGLLFCLHLED